MRNVLIGITAFIWITLIVLMVDPKLHKSVQISNTNYLFNSTPVGTDKPEISKTDSKTQNKEIRVSGIQNDNINAEITNVQTGDTKIKASPFDYMNASQKDSNDEPTDENRHKFVYEILQEQQQKSQETTTETITKKATLTEEETIAWNKWHADVATVSLSKLNEQNADQYLKDNTVVAYSFDVNYKGEISKISIDMTIPSSEYTVATKVFLPILQAYSHDPSLKFPEGTRRKINRFQGIVIRSDYGRRIRYPSEYSDYETIKNYSYQYQ